MLFKNIFQLKYIKIMIFIFFISWQQVLSSLDEYVMIGLITIVYRSSNIFQFLHVHLTSSRTEHVRTWSKLKILKILTVTALQIQWCMHPCWPASKYECIDAWNVRMRKSHHCKSLQGAICCCLWGHEDISLFFVSLLVVGLCRIR
jgi:hypothetical protein